ncbi:hypothetical protein GLOTRDRAFT_95254 [Gloeophyllum trabeum ATCC 11539]|uniref:Uncharacterized protein n=1 Tax=Gloeophyllum trabeum (strain ATCC 11539 / FP-39264 / Madison 617) TaxID=670483 RepID=S7Q189_GLOTA|nr:uncharacterized protein GLOTRDRAFT_95254 [Gloeophyllum trabeum ATCC 11539]EPQ53272.1 hypothetical protein GLOTRDRAFT_95254 [Gloeophyllum trabeum ATCC 11539]
MIVFKICAIARQNRSARQARLVNDVADLEDAIEYMKNVGQVVSPAINHLFALEDPPLVWKNFWSAVEGAEVDLERLENDLHQIGIVKGWHDFALMCLTFRERRRSAPICSGSSTD